MSAKTIAAGTGQSLKVVRTDLRWLATPDDVTGRPVYLRQLSAGNQHVQPQWQVVKYPATKPSAVPPQGNGTEVCPTPTGTRQSGCPTPTGIGQNTCRTPTGIRHGSDQLTGQQLTSVNKKEKKKEKNPGRMEANGPLGSRLAAYSHTAVFAAPLAFAIYKDGRFKTSLLDFLVAEIIPGFNERRIRKGATPDDFIRYAEKRMVGLLQHEAKTLKVHDGHGYVRPGTKKFEQWINQTVRKPWKRVRAHLAKS